MNTRLTIEQLEQMKTHELADLLTNIVLLLRRMPNVTWSELQHMPTVASTPEPSATTPAISPTKQRKRGKQAQAEQGKQGESKIYTQAELQPKTVETLKAIADELNIIYTSKVKKDDLIDKILAGQHGQGHSEQYQIQYI